MVVVKALLAVLPILAAAPTALANHFILTHKMLVTTRLDPIVFPGVISGHVHTIAGASSFDKTMDYAKSRSASCTTAVVSEDKSNYWTPQMYYYNPLDATFTMITVSVMNTYYLTRPGYDGEKITAFPDGLRMISGNPFRKTFDASNPDNAAISFVCLGGGPETRDDPEWFQRNSLFNHNCPGGMRAQVNFRSCWDGKNLDTSDHASHMAWPSGGVDGGTCPSTHPVHLPMLFYEVVYDVQKFPYNNNGTTWVFAQGDTTGYGFHGDFVNGWPSLINGTNILQQAIDHCEVGGVLDNCPPFVPFLDNAAAGACQPANPKVDEDIGDGHGIKALPGNNPVTIAGSTYVSNANNSAIGYIGTTSTIPIDYSYVGCIAEGSLGRALTGASWISATAMTRGACVSFCSDKGFAYAGVEFGQECYCDNMLRNGASSSTLLGESQCGTSCPALNTENCGGGSAITLFVAQSKVVAGKQSAVASGFVEVGCVAEGQNGRALTGPTFTSSTMSRGACTSFCASKGMPLAGVEYGSECYCGLAMANGASNTTLLDNNRCTMACSDSQYIENCGGSSTMVLFQSNSLFPVPTAASSSVISSTTTSSASATPSVPVLPAGWTYDNCRTEGLNGLRGLIGYSFGSGSMTVETCIQTCDSKGFAISGVEFGRECYCSNAWTNKGGAVGTGCTSACAGSSSEICGGVSRLSTYVKGSTPQRRRRAPAGRSRLV